MKKKFISPKIHIFESYTTNICCGSGDKGPHHRHHFDYDDYPDDHRSFYHQY